jgi:aminomethyltransferase
LGYELFLRDSACGDTLWEKIMAAGQPFGLKPGHTSTIRRIEGGMLSYHADADRETNPFEVNLGRLIDLEMEADFIGKSALKEIQASGVERLQVGLEIHGNPLTQPNTTFWPVSAEHGAIGKVTSAVYSPRLEKNIALALVGTSHATSGNPVTVETPEGELTAEIVPIPFYDPRKSLASGTATSPKETVHG